MIIMIKKILIKILIINVLITLFITIICANSKCWAISDVADSTIWNQWQPSIQNTTAVRIKVAPILGVIKVLGIVISVGTIVFMGIRFMCGSIEEKAKYKEQLVPWIIGATMVFAITTIPSIIYDMTLSFAVMPEESNFSDYIRGYDEAVIKAYDKLESYKVEERYGHSIITNYRGSDFLAYLKKEHEENKTMYEVTKDDYYQGICDGLDTVIKRAENIANFIQFAEGYKEAVDEINAGKVTKQNINEALEAAEADKYFYEGKIEEQKYDAKKTRLQNQKNIYYMGE